MISSLITFGGSEYSTYNRKGIMGRQISLGSPALVTLPLQQWRGVPTHCLLMREERMSGKKLSSITLDRVGRLKHDCHRLSNAIVGPVVIDISAAHYKGRTCYACAKLPKLLTVPRCAVKGPRCL